MSGSQQLLLGGAAAAAPAVDPYFYSVTSLLHGDGTNGAQNNTFLDSSTNNFTITRNGNTTQGSFSPFSQTGWSNYFDGTGDFLSVADNAAFTLGTSDFCVESWVYPLNVGTGSSESFISQWSGVASGYGWIFQYRSNKVLMYYSTNGSNIFNAIDAAATISNNAWTHIAFVRSGNTLSAYVNGTRVSNNTSFTANIFDGVTAVNVGRNADNLEYVNGYLSNTRLVVGSSVYDPSQSTITVPTAPLTAVSNTKLLTCQANRFLDASSNAFAITRNGDVSVQPFSPFNPTTAYSTSTVGGSGYFDGSGDYLTAANNAAFVCSGDFTLEMWVYTDLSQNNYVANQFRGDGTVGDWAILILTTGLVRVYLEGTAAAPRINTATGAVTANAWHHLALVRQGSTVTLYVNGVSSGTATKTSNFGVSDRTYEIGVESSSGAYYYKGYLANYRLVNGTAVYTAAFTPPTAPLTAIANTSLLLNFTNAGIFDNAADADYETVGNAQISTSVKKYGTGSMSFDGTGDYLAAPTGQLFSFGTGDFTIECWVYFNSTSGFPTIFSTGTYNTNQLTLRLSSAKFQFYAANAGSVFVTGGITVTTGVWYHVAVCRAAGVTKLFVNGTQDASDSTAFTYSPTGTFSIGETIGNSGQLNGYIDDLRISKGIGRYPYNFTPPTAEFPNIGGTVTLTADPYYDYTTLLLPGNGTNGAQNNTFLDSSTNAFSITRNGNTTQGTFSPFSQTGWGNYFDGSGDYLTAPNNAAFDFGSGDFTIELWFYPTTVSGFQGFCGKRANSPSYGPLSPGISNGAVWLLFSTSGSSWAVNTTGGTLVANQWYHVAIVRSGTSLKAYLNGTEIISTTLSGALVSNSVAFSVGSMAADGGDPFSGYISNFRAVKGTAVYTANFTPSTTPLTAITNTSLLTCQSNRFIDNSSNAFAITRNGDVSVQAFSPFNPTAVWSAATNGGSGYFDGSGDYLTAASNAAFALGTGDFCIEGWYFVYSNKDYNIYFDFRNGSGTAVVPYLYSNSAGDVDYYVNGGSRITASAVIKINQWSHIAVIRSGTDTKMFINGVQVGSTYTDTNNYVQGPLYIGRNNGGGTTYDASYYCSGFRVVKGTTGGYGTPSSTITVPTAPKASDANTSVLLNYTNAGIYDATSKNDLETVGNAQISTTQSKFGGSSIYFDGSGDYLLGPWNPPTDLGAGDFTIEFWMYPTAAGQSSVTYLFNLATNANYGPILIGQAASGYGIVLYASSTGSSWNLASGSSFGTATQNAWNHVALTRYGADVRLFLNGVAATTLNWGTTALLTGSSYRPNIGSGGGVANTFYTGYMQDLRVTKGIARYTSNFTPPTTAFLTL